jgi:hypothetical protein
VRHTGKVKSFKITKVSNMCPQLPYVLGLVLAIFCLNLSAAFVLFLNILMCIQFTFCHLLNVGACLIFN